MIRRLYEDWFVGDPVITWMMAAVAVIIVGSIFLVIWAIKSDNEWRADCHSKGGKVVQVGEHPVLVGKVIVEVPEYECRLPR